MRFMIMVPSSPAAEAGQPLPPGLIEKLSQFNQALQKAGVLLERAGLSPTAHGARVQFGAGKPRVVDGPFPETTGLIAGFWLIQVKSRAEAIEWASRAPFDPGVTLEVRQLADLVD